MERWVFGYRSVGIRPLTADEISSIHASRPYAFWGSIAWSMGAVGCGLATLAAIPIATDGQVGGAGLLVAGVFGFFIALTHANASSELSQAFGRALKTGTVEEFVRQGPKFVAVWSAPDGEDVGPPPQWFAERKFVRVLKETTGDQPRSICMIDQMGAVVFVDGRVADRVMTPEVREAS